MAVERKKERKNERKKGEHKKVMVLLLLHSVGLLVFYPSFWPAISLPTLNYFTTQYRLNNTFSIHPPSKDATITHRPEMCAASSPTTLHLAFSTKKFLV